MAVRAASSQRRLRVRPRRVGIGRLCSEQRGMSGDGAGAVRQQGLLRRSQRGPRARDVTKDYSRGTPSYGYSARVP
jgi:hypothetical protein